jgi:hypothetical protein
MAVDFVDLGSHKNVYAALFGDGDVYISQAVNVHEGKACILFHNVMVKGHDPKWRNEDLNDLPLPDMALVFEDPATIAMLIQHLAELQRKFF